MTRRIVFLALLGVVGAPFVGGSGRPHAAQSTEAGALLPPVAVLQQTDHALLPADAALFWMTPTSADLARTAAATALATAVKLEDGGQSAKALPIVTPLKLTGPLQDYARYYKGLVQLSLGRATDARAVFRELNATSPVGYLSEAGPLAEAESSEGLGDYKAAFAIYQRLATEKTTSPEDVLMRLGRAAEAVGDTDTAVRTYSRVYYEYPFSEFSGAADLALGRLPNRPAITTGSNRFQLELGRAERLFGGRQYSAARLIYERLRPFAENDDAELVSLRLAECDYYMKRLRLARDGVKPYLERASRQGEALFFYAVAIYDLGDRDEYFRIVRRIADDFPTQTWSEEALNHLAMHYVRDDADDKADETFRELFKRFPSGRYAERAAWKVGWLAYRNQKYSETISVFEQAAATFPRSDYRPAWLYWSARAYDGLNRREFATARYKLTATDYFNSYYGRLALSRLDAPAVRKQLIAASDAEYTAAQSTDPDEEPDAAEPLPPNREVIRALLGLGLYAQAIDEVKYAQKVWGDSAANQATLAWIYQRQGQAEKGGRPQFALYRNAINTMKRAYPQYLAVSGERLPDDVTRVIFPLNYWDLIRKYSAANALDPYLVAALVGQESTFVRDIRSPAKAVGLMQLMPATGRTMARRLGLKYSATMLTSPEASIRLGTAYLAQNLKEFGELHYVLASYNAGERRVRQWIAERPGLPKDEFIDDIPFPETQNYVKRILGTAEDYRRLYGTQ